MLNTAHSQQSAAFEVHFECRFLTKAVTLIVGLERNRDFSLFERHNSGTIPTEPLALPTDVLATVVLGVRRRRSFYGEDFAFR